VSGGSEHHRRASDKRLMLPVIWLVAERQQARTADSEREWHTQQVSVFRRDAAAAAGVPNAHEKGRAARRHVDTARVAALLAH
jgi:hypothetical protein